MATEDQASEVCQGKGNKSQLVMADKFYYDLSNQPSYRVQAGICSCVVQNADMSLQKQAPNYDPCLALQPISNDHALNHDFCSSFMGQGDTVKNTAYNCKPYMLVQQREALSCDDYNNKLDKFKSAESLVFNNNNNNNNNSNTVQELNS